MKIAIINIFLVLFSFSSKLIAADILNKNIQIKSDSLKIESSAHKAFFSGNVTAKIGKINFFCGEIIITYNDKGEMTRLIASKNVKVIKNGTTVTSQKAVFKVKKQLILLTGNPTLKKEGNTLKGRTIEVNIDTGTINIIDATGTFSLKSLSSTRDPVK